MQLRPYQESAVNNVAQKLAQGTRKVVLQLATGGGKTIIFSAICDRYTSKSNKSVLILVHRKELLQQTRRTLYNAFNIVSQVIVAGMKHVPPAKVYVGMIESTMRRIPQIKDIGLVIIDEAHIATFNKIHEHFQQQFIIGFTATPLSANKRKPMRDFYDDIVCGVDIPELIESGHLCQNITFSPRDSVDRSRLTIKNGEFDEGFMAVQFSSPQYINNVIKAYKKHAEGTKAVVFNVNIQHSIEVNNAFILAGYNSRHLDGTMTAAERHNTLQWFKTTPGAILNNVALFTAGWDEPTTETVIFNKATMSMPLWLQCTGRGARPLPHKSAFTIIDLGSNAVTHRDWCDARNWEDIFNNPPKASKKEGVAPVKNCPQCDAIIAASARVCKHCGYEFPGRQRELEEELSDFVIVTKGIDVRRVINENRARKEYYPFFKIGKDLAADAKRTIPVMTDEYAAYVLEQYYRLAKEWAAEVGKAWNIWMQDQARAHLYNELNQLYKKWDNPLKKQNVAA